MARYNKLWAALLLGLAYVAMKYYGVLPIGLDPVVVDTIASVLVAYGVYQVPNRD